MSFGSRILYIKKCKQANLLPLADRFQLNDLILLHKVLYNLIPLKLPDYLVFFNGISRLRSCHLDRLSLVHLLPSSSTTGAHLNKSFFFRTHTIWNNLPLEIREITDSSAFKSAVTKRLWKLIFLELSDEDDWCEEEIEH